MGIFGATGGRKAMAKNPNVRYHYGVEIPSPDWQQQQQKQKSTHLVHCN